jgi:hypothetical protein
MGTGITSTSAFSPAEIFSPQGGQHVVDKDYLVPGLLLEFWRELRKNFLRSPATHHSDLGR